MAQVASGAAIDRCRPESVSGGGWRGVSFVMVMMGIGLVSLRAHCLASGSSRAHFLLSAGHHLSALRTSFRVFRSQGSKGAWAKPATGCPIERPLAGRP